MMRGNGYGIPMATAEKETMISCHGRNQGLIIAFSAFLVVSSSVSLAQQQDEIPTSHPGIRLISPEQQTVVRPGQQVPVRIEIDPALNPHAVLITGNMRTGVSLALDGPPFTGSLKIPERLAGSIELLMIVLDTARKSVGGLAIHLNVVPVEAPQRIYNGDDYHLKLPPSSFVGSRTIYVKGIYDDVERNISDPVTGTRYRSSDTSVVTVDDHGILEPLAPGRAFVIVEHRGLKGFARVEVEGEGKTSRDFAPIDCTDVVSITASAPRKREGSVRYDMDVEIRNDADLPLALPLHLVITGLAEGIRVDGGKTSRVEPIGSPVVFVDVDEQSFLSPGNSARATVTFINFDEKQLDHRLRLYSGGNL
jgi:hypothetical protein